MFRPAAAAVSLLLAGATPAAAPGDSDAWRKFPFGSSWIVTNAEDEEARELARQLAAFRALLEDTTTNLRFDGAAPTLFVAFRSVDELRGFDGAETKGSRRLGVHVRPGTAGMERFVATAADAERDASRGRIYRSLQGPYSTLIHEYVHHILDASFAELPRWVDEGLATYYSTFWAERRHAVLGRPAQRALFAARAMTPVPMDTLFDLPDRPARSDQEWLAHYGQSWAVVYACLRGKPERREQFGRFLYLLRQGRDQREAWAEAFDVPPDAVRNEAFRIVRRGVFRIRRYDIRELALTTLRDPEPVAPGEIEGILAKLKLRVGEDVGSAELLAEAALAADPSEARALGAMSEIRARQGRPEDAAAFAERALRAARGNRSLELEASLVLVALGQGERAAEVMDELRSPDPQP